MKILIIGATGLLAKPVISQLDHAGHKLRLFSRSIDRLKFKDKYEVLKGDLFDKEALDNAIKGCDAIHINISKIDESKAMEAIVKSAKAHKIQLISYISGASVCEENRWFSMTDFKYKAEQILIKSGIQYLIFRPSWFFESLSLMVQNGKANLIGNQKNPYYWIAADDYASMVTKAYEKTEARDHSYYIFGPESMLMEQALEKYIQYRHPEIKKVSSVSVGVLKFIAWITRNKELKNVLPMFAYFERTPEIGDPTVANNILGKPTTTLEKWLSNTE